MPAPEGSLPATRLGGARAAPALLGERGSQLASIGSEGEGGSQLAATKSEEERGLPSPPAGVTRVSWQPRRC